MSEVQSNQVCIKRFRRTSTSRIFSYTHCCIAPQISKFKAHDDSGPLWWNCYTFGAYLFGNNITFSVFWLSQGSVASLIKRGGRSSYRHMCHSFLANVNSCSRSLFAVARPSVCLSSVTLVHPTQAVVIFGNLSTAFGTLAIRWHAHKILWRSSQGNPSVGGVKPKRGSKI